MIKKKAASRIRLQIHYNLKRVVICSKFITFVVEMTTRKTSIVMSQ